MERIRKDMPKLLRSEPIFGFGGGRDGVRITLSGQSTDVLQSIAVDLVPQIAALNGLSDVQTELDAGQFEVVIRIDRERVHNLGLSSAAVAKTVATALRGERLRSFRGDPNGEIDLRVAFDKELETSLIALQRLPITQQQGRVIALEDIATLTKQPRLNQIRRTDRRTSLNIDANLVDLTTSEAREKITQLMNQVQLPQGYLWSLDGSFQRQQENESVMLVNTLLAIALIYIVMAA